MGEVRPLWGAGDAWPHFGSVPPMCGVFKPRVLLVCTVQGGPGWKTLEQRQLTKLERQQLTTAKQRHKDLIGAPKVRLGSGQPDPHSTRNRALSLACILMTVLATQHTCNLLHMIPADPPPPPSSSHPTDHAGP